MRLLPSIYLRDPSYLSLASFTLVVHPLYLRLPWTCFLDARSTLWLSGTWCTFFPLTLDFFNSTIIKSSILLYLSSLLTSSSLEIKRLTQWLHLTSDVSPRSRLKMSLKQPGNRDFYRSPGKQHWFTSLSDIQNQWYRRLDDVGKGRGVVWGCHDLRSVTISWRV